MSKRLCIVGTGGFARETFFLARTCGFNVEAFIDLQEGESIYGIPVRSESYFDSGTHMAVVAIGNPILRGMVVQKINNNTEYPALIHPNALFSETVNFGHGAVVCANVILTCDVTIGDHAQLNLGTTVGHGVKAGHFFTTAPGVHISGNNLIGNHVYFGTNSSTVENVRISSGVTIGASACVVRNIEEPGTYVGVPASRLIRK